MTHVCDEYCAALEKTKTRIEKYPCPDGLVDWLRKNEPRLYQKFYVDIPCTIELLWQEKAPLREFNAVLDRWAEVHAQAIKLYEEREPQQVMR